MKARDSMDSVFLSSTRQDLIPFRESVSRALKHDGYEVIEMERFGARSEEPLEACLQEVLDADLFVGIYARRYGFVPPSSGISITEREYVEARRRNKACFCFFLAEGCSWPEELCDKGPAAAQLAKFKAQVREDLVVDWFATPEELADKVRTQLRQRKPRSAEDNSREGRFRRDLLDRVEQLCIREWLRKNVPVRERLRVRRQDCPRAVGKLEAEVPPADLEPCPTDVVEPIYDTFRAQSCGLLILGEPGAGKTITLLELCDSLLKEARRDPTSGIPLVLNLGSWRWRGLGFETWMKREIASKFDIGEKKARQLIAEEQIVPLLDGLDEVDPDAQSACVDAINAYLKARDLPVAAVCCHSRVYEELTGRLHLHGAVALCPLSPGQIDERLAAAGPGLAALRTEIAADPELQQFANTPLMLVLLERTCRDAGPDAVREIVRGPLGDRRKEVFGKYVTRMLEPQLDLPWTKVEKDRGLRSRLPWNRYSGERTEHLPTPEIYPSEKTCRSLGWLAARMGEHDPELLVEQIQPAWLPTSGGRTAYALSSRALAGALLAAPLAFGLGDARLVGFGLLAGIPVGLTDVRRLQRASAEGEERSLKQNVGRSLMRALLLFLGVFLFFLLLAVGMGKLSDVLMPGALLGVLFGLVLGTRGASRDGSNDVHISRVRLRFGRWSGKGALWGAASLLLLSAVGWAASVWRSDLTYLQGSFWLILALLATLFGSLWGGLLGAVEDTPLRKSVWPNQGVWLTLRNASLVALFVAAVVALSLGVLSGAIFLMPSSEATVGLPWGRLKNDLTSALRAAAVVGLWAGLGFSGLDFVQHYTLRLVLRLAGLVPLRLTRFLNYLNSRGLLQRVGGSYRFQNPLLREHFATLPPPPQARSRANT